MHIYLSAGKDKFRFPLTPDSIQIKKGTTSVSFQVIKTGEHKIPRGIQVTGYSWTGVLPGKSMSKYGFVFDWKPPKEIMNKLTKWQEDGEILTLLATQSIIKDKVFIESLNFTYSGVDNVNYTISFSKYRELTITTKKKKKKPAQQQQQQEEQQQQPQQPQTGTKPPVVPENPEQPILSVDIPESEFANGRNGGKPS